LAFGIVQLTDVQRLFRARRLAQVI
jgi:hypothetical protein